jgi:hypothetical protein
MCHFITLVAPRDQESKVRKVLEARGRVARRMSNDKLTKLTPQGSAQYLTTSTCDCGTVLGMRRPTPVELASAHDKVVDRLLKKGWSYSKIERSLANKKAALATSTARKPTDTFELWSNVIGDLVSNHKISDVGLFLHSYRGGIEDEPLEPKVRRAPANMSIADTLQTLDEDELVFFNKDVRSD